MASTGRFSSLLALLVVVACGGGGGGEGKLVQVGNNLDFVPDNLVACADGLLGK